LKHQSNTKDSIFARVFLPVHTAICILHSVAKTDECVAAVKGTTCTRPSAGEIKHDVNGVNLPSAKHSRSNKQEYKLC